MGDDGRKATEVTMSLDRGELAARVLVALAPLREGTPAALAREAFTLAAAFDREAHDNASLPSLADAEWRDAPRAAPSPAASPAAYVPKCGDVVRVARPPTEDEWEGFMDKTWTYNHCSEGRVVETDHYHAKNGKVSVVRADGMRPDDIHGVEACRLVLTERKAEGVPAIGPDHPQGGQGAEGDQRVAAGLDAPAKPAFDETSEREAAVDIAKDRGLDVAEEVGFVAGWLARARIAANGGVA